MFIPAVHAPLLHRTPQAHQMPRSRELAGHLRAAIAIYRRDHPKVTAEEIVAALQTVRELEDPTAAAAAGKPVPPAHDAPPTPAVRLLLIMLLGLTAFGATIWLLNSNKYGAPLVWPTFALALTAAVGAIVAFTLWRDR